MQSHSKLSRDKLLWIRQRANNILCIPASRLPTTSTHMTSSLSSPCLIMDCLISTAGGRKTKQQSVRAAHTAECPQRLDPSNNNCPSSFQILSRRSEQQKSILTWFFFLLLLLPLLFFFLSLYLKKPLPHCTPGKLNWVSAAWVVVVSMATAGPTEHEHWGRHLAMLFIPHHSQKWC